MHRFRVCSLHRTFGAFCFKPAAAVLPFWSQFYLSFVFCLDRNLLPRWFRKFHYDKVQQLSCCKLSSIYLHVAFGLALLKANRFIWKLSCVFFCSCCCCCCPHVVYMSLLIVFLLFIYVITSNQAEFPTHSLVLS